MTDDQRLAWVAGFFDGEGCVAICRVVTPYGKKSRTDPNRKVSINYTMSVSICQKDPAPLELIHSMFGGHFYDYQVKGVTYWRWHTWSETALQFLKTVQPFLMVKRERCDIAVHFQEEMTIWNREYGRRGYPKWINEARADYFERMRFLNRRGVADDNPDPKTPGVKKGSPNFFSRKNDRKETQSTDKTSSEISSVIN